MFIITCDVSISNTEWALSRVIFAILLSLTIASLAKTFAISATSLWSIILTIFYPDDFN